MLDANTKTARTVAVSAVMVAAAVHSCMNAAFGWSLGSHPLEKYLFAAFGIAVDICKVFALAFAAYAWARGYRVKSLCCGLIWITTVAYSGAAAMGFAALARDTVVASRSADVDDYQRNAAEKRRFLADMEAARTNPLFVETFGCTKDLPAKSKTALKASQFCHMYWRASKKYDELQPIVRAASMTQADPQTAIIASVFRISTHKAAVGLSVFLALVAEIISALGTWTFSKSIRKAERQEERRRPPGGKYPRLAVDNS